MSCEPQLPRFISVSYKMGSRDPDLHVFNLSQSQKSISSERKVPNKLNHVVSRHKAFKAGCVVVGLKKTVEYK